MSDEDDFSALFDQAHGPARSPEQSARARAQRERSMRSPHSERRSPQWKGDRVQFNRKVPRRLKDQVVAACKRYGINETDALEQAFQLWLTHMRKKDA